MRPCVDVKQNSLDEVAEETGADRHCGTPETDGG